MEPSTQPARRTDPNLLAEARHLTDDSLAYGALILSRAIAHAMRDAEPEIISAMACLPRIPAHAGVAVRIIANEFGSLINEAVPGKKLTARRIVIMQDAAKMAFA